MYFVPEPLSNCPLGTAQGYNKRLYTQNGRHNNPVPIQKVKETGKEDKDVVVDETSTRNIMGHPTIIPLKPSDLNFEDGVDYLVVEIKAPRIAWLDRTDIHHVLIETRDESMIYSLSNLRTFVRNNCNLNQRVKSIEKAVFNIFRNGDYSYTLIPIVDLKNASSSSPLECAVEVRTQKQYSQIRFHKRRHV